MLFKMRDVGESAKEGNGCFIVLEGIDGSGKETQFKLLHKRLSDTGYNVEVFDFPRYDLPSSYFVKKYLNGAYGTLTDVGPYTAALFYALDRYEASLNIREALREGKVVLANRFTGSNMAHQGAKFMRAEQRRGFFIWLDNLEFEMLQIPRPDMSFILHMPASIAQGLVNRKAGRMYTDKRHDIHEADIVHLSLSAEVYDDLALLFPKDFQRIDCIRDGNLLDIEEVHSFLWEKVMPLLPSLQPHPKKPAEAALSTTTESTSLIDKQKEVPRITAAGHAFLSDALTNPNKNVYAFNDKLNASTIAAALVRLEKTTASLRVTLLDEFATSLDKDRGQIAHTLPATHADSTRQLVNMYIVVENASNLLAKQLEHGRLATYVEQSTGASFFGKKDGEDRDLYYIPDRFDAGTKQLYVKTMNQLFSHYAAIVHPLTGFLQYVHKLDHLDAETRARNLARAVLPVATATTVGICTSIQGVENLIVNLLSSDLPEVQDAGKSILEEARQAMPAFLSTDTLQRIEALVTYRRNTRTHLNDIAKESLPSHYAPETGDPVLVDVWPRNELDLVPDMLYELSDQPLRHIQQKVNEWTYDQKLRVFEAYMGARQNAREKPGRTLEKAHYSWDIICDYDLFRDLQRHRTVDDLEWQVLTPRYGYEVPDIIEEAELAGDFEHCFDLSLKLHSHLVQAGYADEAQYATLFGHRMRWKVTYNAREAFHIHELHANVEAYPSYHALILKMHEKLAAIHPILAKHMKFINQNTVPQALNDAIGIDTGTPGAN